MFVNIIIAFVLIYIGHQTRNLELINNKLTSKIEEKKIEIDINQSEFALHNDHQYLIKLYSLYIENRAKKEPSKVISIKEFLKLQNEKILQAGLK